MIEIDNKELTGEIISCAIKEHKHLGSVLPESAYQQCLINELKQIDLKVVSKK